MHTIHDWTDGKLAWNNCILDRYALQMMLA